MELVYLPLGLPPGCLHPPRRRRHPPYLSSGNYDLQWMERVALLHQPLRLGLHWNWSCYGPIRSRSHLVSLIFCEHYSHHRRQLLLTIRCSFFTIGVSWSAPPPSSDPWSRCHASNPSHSLAWSCARLAAFTAWLLPCSSPSRSALTVHPHGPKSTTTKNSGRRLRTQASLPSGLASPLVSPI